MNITDHQGMFCNGKAAAFTRGIDTYSGIAAQLAAGVPDPEIAAHLRHLCALNRKIAHAKPETFEEACQFLLWYQMACRSYNGSGSLGRLDALLYPYYARETAAGTLDDERAVFLIACLLLRDTAYVHLGGYNRDGSDATNPVSYLVLEAVHRLKLPSNVGVCVGKGLDRNLLRKSVEYQFADKNGNPRFVGMETLVRGLVRNEGVSIEDARMRTNSGCHWLAIPGREYSMMDCVKINFSVVLDIALREAVEKCGEPSIDQILDLYTAHLRIAIQTLAKGFDFHYDNQIRNVPELPLDLMCHGPSKRAWTPRAAAWSTTCGASTARPWPLRRTAWRPSASASCASTASPTPSSCTTWTPTGRGRRASARASSCKTWTATARAAATRTAWPCAFPRSLRGRSRRSARPCTASRWFPACSPGRTR